MKNTLLQPGLLWLSYIFFAELGTLAADLGQNEASVKAKSVGIVAKQSLSLALIAHFVATCDLQTHSITANFSCKIDQSSTLCYEYCVHPLLTIK